MPDGSVNVLFVDNWMWLIFIAAGLFLVILELIMGIDTGLDLVFIGSAFVIGGLVTFAINSWVWTAVVSGIICLIYVLLGRRYLHRKMAVKSEKSNIDTIVGKIGIVEQEIEPDKAGLVKVGYEKWHARSEESLRIGEEITVTGVSGVTLNVKKIERGKE